MRSHRRRRWLFALKAAISLALLAWLGGRMLARDGVGALADRMSALDAGWLVVAIALHFAAVVAGTARWRLLLGAARIELGFPFLLRSFLVGRFVGAFTPSTTGLDGWRLYEVGKASGAMGRSAAVIVVEKLVGLVSMALVCATLVPLGGVSVLGPGALAAALALALGAALGLGLLRRPAWMERVAVALPRPLAEKANVAVDALSASRLDAPRLARALALGVASHLALSAVFFATARAIGVDVAPVTLLVVGNAIVLAVLLPISIGGVGVREGVAVALLSAAGVGATDAVLIGLLGYITGQVPALAGGVLMAASRRGDPAPTLAAPTLAAAEQSRC